jgi:hypothetical protein
MTFNLSPLAEIARFTAKHKELAFGLTDTEDFVTGAGVPMVCIKADQRILFEEI